MSLKGERTALHVTFDLLPSVFSRLPEDLTTADIKVHPVLFNKGALAGVCGGLGYELSGPFCRAGGPGGGL